MLSAMTKTLHLLIGPKGAGKTYIGKLVERELGIRFLRVEPIWLSLQPGHDGWHEVERRIDEAFTTTDELIIESLGIGNEFIRMQQSLAGRYRLRFVKVTTGLDECLQRVRGRNSHDHIPLSDAQVEAYNDIAAKAVHPWSAKIENGEFATKELILAAFRQ